MSRSLLRPLVTRICRISVAAFLTLLIISPAPAQEAIPPDSVRQTLDAIEAKQVGDSAAVRLTRLMDLIWNWRLASNPEFANILGLPVHSDQLTDYSRRAIDQRQATEHAFLETAERLDRSQLPEDRRLAYDLVHYDLTRTVEGHQYPGELMPLTQKHGLPQSIPQLLRLMPASTPEDFENRLERLAQLPRRIDQVVALMRDGLSRGITPPRVTLRDVPQQVNALLTDSPLDSPLAASFQRYPESFSEDQKQEFRQRATQRLEQEVFPALRELSGFLQDEYLPGARASISAAALPDGEAWYDYNVRLYTTTDLTSGEIHEIGRQEIKRIEQEMQNVMRDAGFDGSREEFAEYLQTDEQFYFASEDELLRAYRAICKRADAALPGLFGKLPRLPYGVEPAPDHVAKSQSAAYYRPGSFAAGRPGTFFVNTYDLDSRPNWQMESLVLHEAVPGHHLQFTLAQELEDLHPLLRYSYYTAFIEGWGLYAETLGEEMGFYQDPYARYGRLTGEILRAIRLVVDTGMHALGWSRERAIDFFQEHSAVPAEQIISEVDRYIVWPGQALAYKIGQRKIEELRSEAEETLGSEFDIRAFHDELLSAGALPLDLLEERMNAWVAKQAREATSAD